MPYGTKILSAGLLVFDSLFLKSSSLARLFSYDETYVLWQVVRGFQISTQIVVGSMALERLFVIKWPYVYLRVATKRRIRKVCTGMFFTAFIQFFVVRGLACYARNKPTDCGWPMSVYFVLVSFLIPTVSFICYGRIYGIIREKRGTTEEKIQVKHYKGTLVSFLYLINSTIILFIMFGLSVLFSIRTSKGVKEDGLSASLADSVAVVNCIVDPLIYVLWFKEVQFEFLKLFQVVC